MSRLNLSLILINALFWFGSFAYYWRRSIYEWLDNRIRHEPVTNWLRAVFRSQRG